METIVLVNGKPAAVRTLDCRQFKNDAEMTQAILDSGDGLLMIDGEPDNDYYRRMDLPETGQTYRCGDIVRRSRDFLETSGITDSRAFAETAVVTGVKYSPHCGRYLYTCRTNDGREWMYEWYQLEPANA